MSKFRAELGRWWVAGEPDSSVVGYLDVAKPRGGPWRLTVEGRLAEMTPPGFDTHRTIHGHTTSGDYTILRAGTTSTRRGRIRTQQWRGWQLIKGGHVEPDQRFAYASFRLANLWHWLGPSSLNYHTTKRFTADKDSQDNQVLTAHLDNGLQLDLGPSFTERRGRTGESWTGFGIYSLHGEPGLTFEDLEQVSLAMTRLHAIVTGSPMDDFGVRLLSDFDESSWSLEVVDPRAPAGSSWGKRGHKDLFFDTAEIDFTQFIPEWMNLHHRALAAVAVAAPRDDRPFVTSKLVDTCNGLETLANYLWPEPDLTSKDQELLSTLKDLHVNGELRGAVELTLRNRRWSLENKLVRLVATLGADSASWLVGPSLPHWAHVVARLRNSIAHGFSLPAGLSDDIPFTVMAQVSATAVLQLALLRQAGYHNAMSRTPGELLWSGDQHVFGHPNSPFVKDLERLARYADQWDGWYRRSQQPRQD